MGDNLEGDFKFSFFEVEPEKAGLRIDQFLREKIPEFSRSRIQKLIGEGFILLEQRRVKPSQKVKAGQRIEVQTPPEEELEIKPQDVPLEIIYEDGDLAIIYKPSCLVVHPAPGHKEGTLVHGLLKKLKDLSGIGGKLRPGIVHRLDKDTSGIMLVAKNDFTHQALIKAFKERKVSKEYLALLWGNLKPSQGLIETFIGRHPVYRKKMAVLKEGKIAITSYQVLKYFKRACLVLAKPITGRTHQLRVHFSYLGHPILGDPIYGGLKFNLPQPKRLMLHACKITFTHPRTGETLTFYREAPEDFQNYLCLERDA